MKSLSPALQAHLDEGTTTLAWCWRITRADGQVFGFTDHDRTLSFEASRFEPESGFAGSELRASGDLAVDAQDAEGVLTSSTITEADIAAGLWDGAAVEVWRVNWQDPSQRGLMRRGAIGEISGPHVSEATALWLQTMAPLGAGDTVELQGYFRAADGYFTADHTTFWGAKVG